MYNPENRIIRNIDTQNRRQTVERAKTPENLAEKFALAQKVLKGSEIDPESFADMYSPKMLARHRREVEEVRGNFDAFGDAERRGVIFEAATLSGIREGDIFGRDMTVFKTAPYDDIFNKADFVLEHTGTQGPSSLVFTADAGTSPKMAEKKIEDIVSEVEQGKLTEIQYFQTAHFKGRALNIPRIVLGVERDTALEFDDLWFGVQTGKRPAQALKHSPVRGIFIHEALEQFKVFSAYATRKGNKVAAEAYRRSLNIVEHAVKAAKEDGVHINMHPKDSMHRSILESLYRLT